MSNLLKFHGKDIQDISLESWLAERHSDLHPIVIKWLEVIDKCGPDVEIIFHDNYPIGCVDQAAFAYVNAFSSHVNLGFFYGAELFDETGILEGTGKRMRHVKLRPNEDADEKVVSWLVHAAYADIKSRLKME